MQKTMHPRRCTNFPIFLFVCFLLGDLASNCARIFAKLNPIPDITESLSRNFQVFESTPVERAHCTSGLKNACEIKMSWTKEVYQLWSKLHFAAEIPEWIVVQNIFEHILTNFATFLAFATYLVVKSQ